MRRHWLSFEVEEVYAIGDGVLLAVMTAVSFGRCPGEEGQGDRQ